MVAGRRKTRLITLLLLLFSTSSALADEKMLQMDIGRGAAKLPLYVMSRPDALATLILLPGGDSATGKIANGKPTSSNFLSRTREAFFAEAFNVIVVFRASDLSSLEYEYRISQAHIAEIEKAIDYAKREWAKPVWLVGTSKGTVSATAAAIALGEKAIAGLVLTSSVTSGKIGAVATQALGSIRVPTLVVHHRKDVCKICVPAEASRIPEALPSAPIKKFVMVEGGSGPSGDPCGARHWHGFVNYEEETANLIARWIKNPVN